MVAGPAGESLNKVIIFRADASLQIGTGHVMRCLTLADALTAQGATCEFICREHPGNLIAYIQSKGYIVHSLSVCGNVDTDLTHSTWLGSTQAQDAEACIPILSKLQPDWLVVDHYALDARWEKNLTPYYRKLMVIDDLADRQHACDVFLDQNLGRAFIHYSHLITPNCQKLLGSNYVILRPEFARQREASLSRRKTGRLNRILLCMGGVDKDNFTGRIIQALDKSTLPTSIKLDVVLGSQCPHINQIKELAASSRFKPFVHVNAQDMANRMCDADLAIGAAGGTTWERFCMGLPSLLLSTAANQDTFLNVIKHSGAAKVVDLMGIPGAVDDLNRDTSQLYEMSKRAALLVDGNGVSRIAEKLLAT